ncbi:MAG: O-antigen ligase family protein [Gammaproteobacteria bacterium]|nr:O-antigen ligase family protein [Gammaproteobacteria bacterium]
MPLVLAFIGCTVSLHQADAWKLNLALQADIDPERKYLFGATYLLALVLCIRRSREAILLLKQNLPYIVLLAFMAASTAWSLFPLKVMVSIGHAVGFVAVVIATVMAVRNEPARLFRTLAVTGGVIIVASLATVIILPERGAMNIGGTVRWVGLSSHPNTLGLTALVTVWASSAVWSQTRVTRVRLACLFAIGMALISLYGANSITAGVLALATIFGMPCLVWLLERAPEQRVVLSILLFLVIIVGAFVGNLLMPEIVASEVFLKIVGRNPTLTGRTELWQVAFVAIEQRPLLGWSFDALQSLGGAGVGRVSQFHNGYVDVLVRGGWIGLTMVVWLVAVTAARLIRSVWIDTRIWVPLAILLVIILLHNVTEASLARSPSALWLLFSLVMFILPTLTSHGRSSPKGWTG